MPNPKKFTIGLLAVVTPFFILFVNSTVTVVPGSPAEFWNHCVSFYLPFLFLPILIGVARKIGSHVTLGIGCVLIMTGGFCSKSLDSYLPVSPIKIEQGTKNGKTYVNSGKWYPYCKLHTNFYVNYEVDGISYHQRPEDLFRMDAEQKVKHIYFCKREPHKILVSKESYVTSTQRGLVVWGLCCIVAAGLIMMRRFFERQTASHKFYDANGHGGNPVK